MKDRKFNLIEASIGAPIQTKNGDTVKFVAYEADAIESQRVVCLLGGKDGFRMMEFYNEQGISNSSSSPWSDLEMKPRKVTRWMNVEPPVGGTDYPKVRWYHSKEDAKSWATTASIAIAVPMEFTE